LIYVLITDYPIVHGRSLEERSGHQSHASERPLIEGVDVVQASHQRTSHAEDTATDDGSHSTRVDDPTPAHGGRERSVNLAHQQSAPTPETNFKAFELHQHEPTADTHRKYGKFTSSLYTPLSDSTESIRLLSIDASPNDVFSDAVHCTLSVAQPWTSATPYECLSYCWGEPRDHRQIFVRVSGSQYHTGTVSVNLHNALRRLQSTHTSKLLWIDALCIDQGNLLERAAQVSMMREIYSRASGVIVWLGECTCSLSAAVACITTISTRFQTETDRTLESIVTPLGLQLSFADIERLKTYTDLFSNDDDYALVAHFFSIPYFRRVW